MMKQFSIRVFLLLSIFLVHGAFTTVSEPVNYTLPALNKFSVAQDIVWATPAGVKLTMDIYTPDTGKKNYPVYVIYHGGGWLINNETIMDQMSRYIVEHGEYVVCNVNYRLLTASNNTTHMNQIIEDALGAVAWIKENINQYKGNPKKIAVSGDSAGGHLAAMVANSTEKLDSDGFAGTPGFTPTYLPKGKTPEQLARSKALDVQAVVLNYPAVDIYQACLGNFESDANVFWNFGQAKARGIFGDKVNVKDHAHLYKVVSPMYTIPDVKKRKLPPTLCAVGSKDNLTTPEQVKGYADALAKAGHPVEYWVHQGRPHAYLDSGSNEFLGINFEKDAPIAIDRIILFLDSVFYPK